MSLLVAEKVAGVVLAAGSSSRMRGPFKLLLPFGSSTVVRCAVDAATASGLNPVIAVVGDRAGEMRTALRGSGVSLVHNPVYPTGQGSSLAAGVRAARSDSTILAVAILLGDEPDVRPAAIQAVVAGWRNSGAPAARAVYRDRPGHPVVFGRGLFSSLLELEGDRDAAKLLKGLGTALWPVRLDELAPVDVDTPADYESAVVQLGSRGSDG